MTNLDGSTGFLNFRDVGGFAIPDGRTVRRGVLFRAAAPDARAAGACQARLERLRISRIIDLRADEELRDPPIDGIACARLHVPLLQEIAPRWSAPVARMPDAIAARYLAIAEFGREALVRVVDLLGLCDLHPTLVHAPRAAIAPGS